jgi:hypothetical protein
MMTGQITFSLYLSSYGSWYEMFLFINASLSEILRQFGHIPPVHAIPSH